MDQKLTTYWKQKQWRHDTATHREKEAALRPEYNYRLSISEAAEAGVLVGVYVLYSGDASS